MANACPKCTYFYVRCKCDEILLEVENKSQAEQIKRLQQCDDSSTDVIYKMDKEIEEKNNQIRKLAEALALK